MDSSLETPPSASLNRVQIMDLPGLPLEEAVQGQRGDELISNRALIAYAAAHATALGLQDLELPASTPRLLQGDVTLRWQVPLVVNRALSSSDPNRRAAARSIAGRLGHNLGWLLIALHRGDEVNRAVRPDWRPEDWTRWREVRQIWLGGGMTEGQLGALIVQEALDLLERLGYGHLKVDRSPYGSLIALMGAGRTVRPEDLDGANCSFLSLDFGHTLVKRAILTYREGVLAQVKPLAPRPTDWRQILGQEPAQETAGRRVLDSMISLLAETVSQTRGHVTRSPILITVAAYLQQGRLVSNGPYASIHDVGDTQSASALVSARLSHHIGHPIEVRLIHDGTAASLAHAGSACSAVIMVGSALGVGFPPKSEDGLRPLEPGLLAASHQHR